MAEKNNKKTRGKLKIRGGKDLIKELDAEPGFTKHFQAPNPIQRQIKLNQFPWTEKQKEFFKVA